MLINAPVMQLWWHLTLHLLNSEEAGQFFGPTFFFYYNNNGTCLIVINRDFFTQTVLPPRGVESPPLKTS